MSAYHEALKARRRQLLEKYPDKPWRSNFPDVDWEHQDTLDVERGLKVLALAPTVEVYRALWRGEAVPLDRMNREGVLRYGLRSRPAA
jgi:hypothetical protein